MLYKIFNRKITHAKFYRVIQNINGSVFPEIILSADRLLKLRKGVFSNALAYPGHQLHIKMYIMIAH